VEPRREVIPAVATGRPTRRARRTPPAPRHRPGRGRGHHGGFRPVPWRGQKMSWYRLPPASRFHRCRRTPSTRTVRLLRAENPRWRRLRPRRLGRAWLRRSQSPRSSRVAARADGERHRKTRGGRSRPAGRRCFGRKNAEKVKSARSKSKERSSGHRSGDRPRARSAPARNGYTHTGADTLDPERERVELGGFEPPTPGCDLS
jgi:hypothetical protein